MSKKEIEHPDKKVHTGSYSAAVMANGFLFVSGQGSLDLSTGEVLHGTIEEETRRTLDHIRKIVEAAGGSMDDVVKCSVHLKDIADFDKFDTVYAAVFTGTKPARTTVQSVLGDGIRIEIDAIAFIG